MDPWRRKTKKKTIDVITSMHTGRTGYARALLGTKTGGNRLNPAGFALFTARAQRRVRRTPKALRAARFACPQGPLVEHRSKLDPLFQGLEPR